MTRRGHRCHVAPSSYRTRSAVARGITPPTLLNLSECRVTSFVEDIVDALRSAEARTEIELQMLGVSTIPTCVLGGLFEMPQEEQSLAKFLACARNVWQLPRSPLRALQLAGPSGGNGAANLAPSPPRVKHRRRPNGPTAWRRRAVGRLPWASRAGFHSRVPRSRYRVSAGRRGRRSRRRIASDQRPQDSGRKPAVKQSAASDGWVAGRARYPPLTPGGRSLPCWMRLGSCPVTPRMP